MTKTRRTYYAKNECSTVSIRTKSTAGKMPKSSFGVVAAHKDSPYKYLPKELKKMDLRLIDPIIISSCKAIIGEVFFRITGYAT